MNTLFYSEAYVMNAHTYVIALHVQGKILPETYEAVSFAYDLGGSHKTIVVLGCEPTIHTLADELAARTGIDVLGITAPYLENYCAETYKLTIQAVVPSSDPFTLCIPHTAMGYDFAPALAAAFNAPCITAVEGMHEGSFTRSMFSGKIRAHTRVNTPSAVLTVLPGSWEPYNAASSSRGKVTIIPAESPPVFTRTHGMKEPARADISFADAEVIVSAGRGIGKPQNLALIKDLAGLFRKSAIGSTRAVCDLGWLGYTRQIGSTGNTVSPRVYIACGISGAVQHISGIKNTHVIIAINIDRYAPIFRHASYCIVEDVSIFIPVVIEEYRKCRQATPADTSAGREKT